MYTRSEQDGTSLRWMVYLVHYAGGEPGSIKGLNWLWHSLTLDNQIMLASVVIWRHSSPASS